MPFSDNAFTNSWLENTYSDPTFFSIDFDDFDAAIGLSDSSLNQWDASYLQPQQPLLDTYSSPTSECEDLFSSPVLPTTEAIRQKAFFNKNLAPQQNPLKRRSSSIDSEDIPFIAQKQQKPKRGRPCTKHRPRLTRNKATTTSSSASSTASRKNTTNISHLPEITASRTPHNQVERKYRESLNTEMERLRRAVPATARWEENVYSQAGKIKPSKAMVLASAISYIRSLEREMEGLRRENAGLSSGSSSEDDE